MGRVVVVVEGRIVEVVVAPGLVVGVGGTYPPPPAGVVDVVDASGEVDVVAGVVVDVGADVVVNIDPIVVVLPDVILPAISSTSRRRYSPAVTAAITKINNTIGRI